MGKAALAGQPGIVSVRNGWRDGREVNDVVYDHDLISVRQMEKLLRRSGTYLETLPGSD